MRFSVIEVAPYVTKKYPYTHRMEILTDLAKSHNIYDWLVDNNMPFTRTSAYVFYLREDAVEWIMLKWS